MKMGSFPTPTSLKIPTCKSTSPLQSKTSHTTYSRTINVGEAQILQIQCVLAKSPPAKEMQKERLWTENRGSEVNLQKKKHNPSFRFLIQFKSRMKQSGLKKKQVVVSPVFSCTRSVCMPSELPLFSQSFKKDVAETLQEIIFVYMKL